MGVTNYYHQKIISKVYNPNDRTKDTLMYKKADHSIYLGVRPKLGDKNKLAMNGYVKSPQELADLKNGLKKSVNLKLYISGHSNVGRHTIKSFNKVGVIYYVGIFHLVRAIQKTLELGGCSPKNKKNHIKISILACKTGEDEIGSDLKQKKNTSFADSLVKDIQKLGLTEMANKITINAKFGFLYPHRKASSKNKISITIQNNVVRKRHADMDPIKKTLKHIQSWQNKLTTESDKCEMHSIKNQILALPCQNDLIKDCEQVEAILTTALKKTTNISSLFQKKCRIALRDIKSIKWKYWVLEKQRLPRKPYNNGKPCRFKRYRNNYLWRSSISLWRINEKTELRLMQSIYKSILDYQCKGSGNKKKIFLNISNGHITIHTTPRLSEAFSLIYEYMKALISGKTELSHRQPKSILKEIKAKMTERLFMDRWCFWSSSERESYHLNKEFYESIVKSIDDLLKPNVNLTNNDEQKLTSHQLM